jgi:type III restriction enzyme
VTPIPKPRKRTGGAGQSAFVFDEGRGLSTLNQGYDHAPILNRRRRRLEDWRRLPDPRDWRVTPETARLLAHWRTHAFQDARPFF